MNTMPYAVAGYAVALTLMWGYVICLWLAHRAVTRRERKRAANER